MADKGVLIAEPPPLPITDRFRGATGVTGLVLAGDTMPADVELPKNGTDVLIGEGAAAADGPALDPAVILIQR